MESYPVAVYNDGPMKPRLRRLGKLHLIVEVPLLEVHIEGVGLKGPRTMRCTMSS
jgi:hypothetical protein